MKPSTHKQREFQHRILAEAGLVPQIFDDFLRSWWQNPINHDSLRLTRAGYKFFTNNLKLPCYEIELSDPIRSLHLIQLERQFQEPYFVDTARRIYVFGQQDAIMLQLHAGNLAQYLDNLSNG